MNSPNSNMSFTSSNIWASLLLARMWLITVWIMLFEEKGGEIYIFGAPFFCFPITTKIIPRGIRQNPTQNIVDISPLLNPTDITRKLKKTISHPITVSAGVFTTVFSLCRPIRNIPPWINLITYKFYKNYVCMLLFRCVRPLH